MRRLYLVTLGLALGCALQAQIGLGVNAGAIPGLGPQLKLVPKWWSVVYPEAFGDFGWQFPRAPSRKLVSANDPAEQSFDYEAAKPYLAFFCRLELNIEEATRFPVRFRLGEVRSWQQELSKRD